MKINPAGASHTSLTTPSTSLAASNARAPTPARRAHSKQVRATATHLQLGVAVCNWSVWGFISALVLSQFLSIGWSTARSKEHVFYGFDPNSGAYAIAGFNDDPYADRVLACVADGHSYRAVPVSELVLSGDAKVSDTTGASVNGYRVVQRDGLKWEINKIDAYSAECQLIASTLEAIAEFCTALGYTVSPTTDNLRVVNGVSSATTYQIQRSLPVLIMPFWDNAPVARYAIPGPDGNACMLRLMGKYENSALANRVAVGVNRSVREQKTAEWLKRPGGVWRNGWYEDLEGERWYSDVVSLDQRSRLGISARQFNTIKRIEYTCSHTSECAVYSIDQKWGSKLSITDELLDITSVAISNGSRFGLFYYEIVDLRVVQNVYDWETLVSNLMVVALLMRWLMAMYALQHGYLRGESRWHNAGIGSLACAKSFNLLPLMLLPRLKMTLAAFWTVGCDFEGDQKALAEAWFVMYPAIVELWLLYFSVLNVTAKLLRRRVSDSAFGPTVLFFCLLHRCRVYIAQSSWFGIDGRVHAAVFSSEMDALRLLDFFVTDTPFRMNSNVTSLIAIKLAAFGLNLLPLVFTRSTARSAEELLLVEPLKIERALAVRATNLGGLGRSSIYELEGVSQDPVLRQMRANRTALNSYELVRLGFVVYGDRFLISLEDWEIVVSLAMLKRVYHLWNHRVTLFALKDDGDSEDGGGSGGSGKTVARKPELCRIDDPRLQSIPWRQTWGRPIK